MQEAPALRPAAGHAVRCTLILSFDAAATLAAYHLAWLIRFEGNLLLAHQVTIEAWASTLMGIRLVSLFVARCHRWSFRTAGMGEAVRLLGAMVGGSAAFLALTGAAIPPSIYLLEFFLSTTLVAAFRFAPAVFQSVLQEWLRARAGTPRAVVIGAGQAAELLARDLQRSAHGRYSVIGFLDDEEAKHGTSLVGKPVLGRVADLPRLVAERGVTTALLAMDRIGPAQIREILDVCSSCKARFKVFPSSFSEMGERASAAMLHDVAPEDLLPRNPIAFDGEEIRTLVSGRRALITGAAGTIGGEMARQLAARGARELVLVDMNENELYMGVRRLAEDHPGVSVRAEVADIRDPVRIRRLGEACRPEFVFHCAAHKHVPLMEDAPEEAIKNNVLGTLHVARMATACGAERFVLISTDKAVNPSSMMGASKRIAELVVRHVARSSRTQFTAVRFGNVLGSAGSVIPIFKQQIERGGPVTVTHPECARFFMTVPEAVGLVLIAGLRGYGELCVLDMGEPIRIADLARNLITLAGRVPGEEIAIEYTGLRKGEKLREELLTEDEEQTQVVRDGILVARSPAPPPDLEARVEDLRLLAEAGDRDALLAAVQEVVPSYRRPLRDVREERERVRGAVRLRTVPQDGEAAAGALAP